jgi:peptide/nickel transport system substrate-binding protein
MLNKRWALVAALVLAASFVLAACATGEVQTVVVTEIVNGEPVVVTAVPEAAPTQDTIIICMSQEPDSLYLMASTMAVTAQVFHAASGRNWISDRAYFFETQMLVNDEFPSFDNGLAEFSGSGADEVLTVTFQYKPEITWSDGTPFTVDDLIYTRDVLLDPDSGASSRGSIDSQTWEKVDDSTLKISYAPGAKPPLYFIPPFGPSNDVAEILPKHTLEGMTPAEIKDSDYARLPNPVLGPYEFVDWVEGDRMVLKGVDNWWGGDVATPNLIYRFIGDTNQLLASTLSGECDYATSDGLQLTQLPFIQQSAEQGLVKYEAIPSTVWEHLEMNTWPNEAGVENGGFPFFADTRVRQAVAYGTNRQQMTEQILYGEVQPLQSFLPSDHWAWNPDTEGLYPYDPEQAKALLAEAGWEDKDGDGVVEYYGDGGTYSCERGDWTIPQGTPFEVSFHTTTGNAMREQLSTILQSNMADIGMKVNLDLIPASVWFADDGPLFARTYQLGEFAWVSTADPSSISIYGGENIYRTADGEFLTADNILAANPDFLTGTSLTAEDLRFGRPTDEELPEGNSLYYAEQIPQAGDSLEGSNDLGWCNNDATQALFNGDNVIAPEDRLPFFLEAQKLFAEDVPSVPLFQRVEVEAYSPSLCGPARGPSNYASWNVETWTFAADGASCP